MFNLNYIKKFINIDKLNFKNKILLYYYLILIYSINKYILFQQSNHEISLSISVF